MSDEEPQINIVGDLHLEKQGGGRNNHANDVMSPDGISTCMTVAMGNGGGHVPKIIKENDSEGIPMAEGDKPIDIPKAKLRIRYLTPRECLRLMDFTDEQIDRLFAVEKSKSQLYKMAGNSIVVGVLAAIFRAIYIDETFRKPIKRVRLEDFA